jgi:hypothetical protein
VGLPCNGPKAALPKKNGELLPVLRKYDGSDSDLRQVKVPVPVCSGGVSRQ